MPYFVYRAGQAVLSRFPIVGHRYVRFPDSGNDYLQADVKVGDEVIVMGSDGVNSILADDIAEATGTINYEICCAFGQRLPKVYVK